MRNTHLNEKESEKIAKQTEEFLARGGKIEQVPTNIYNHEYNYMCGSTDPKTTDKRRGMSK